MRPDDLIKQVKGQPAISNEQQEAFDLQCFKEFVRSIPSLTHWAQGAGFSEDGVTPWDRMEADAGPLSYFIRGRRVDKFNLMSLAMGKVAKSQLVEAFGDLCEISGGRLTVMVFKYVGDKSQGISGTKMVYMEYSSDTEVLALGCAGIVVPAYQDIPAGFIMTYKSWRELAYGESGHAIE